MKLYTHDGVGRVAKPDRPSYPTDPPATRCVFIVSFLE